MEIRNAKQEDLEDIMNIYAKAREYMAESGNPNQWFDYYPPRDLIENDIKEGLNYVFVEDNKIVGVMALIFGDDPTYEHIEGSWLNNEPYVTIHRIASIGNGVFNEAIKFASSKINNIRIDTHADNKTMQHCILKNGFEYCGVIYCHDGTPRLAYQKKVSD